VTNHIRNSKANEMPSHLWMKISARFMPMPPVHGAVA
jgi:hypothetical protein